MGRFFRYYYSYNIKTLRDKTIELRSQNSATKVEQNFGKPNLEFAPQKWRKTLKTKIELGRKPYFRMCTTPFLPELSILPIYISVRSIFFYDTLHAWVIYFSDKSYQKLKEFLKRFWTAIPKIGNLNCNLLEQWEKKK